MSISTTSLPDGIISTAYSQSIQATGGQTPYTWSKTAGNLPPGLILAASGIITGTPTTANTYTFTVQVQDSTTPTKLTATRQLSIRVVAAGELTCKYSGVNLCQPSGSCPANACSQYSAAINQAAAQVSISGVRTASLIRAIMFNESSCNASARSGSVPPSCGLMQLQPATANTFKNRCGVTANITCDWLTNAANATASICIGAHFLQSLAGGTCGANVRNIAAGYNAGAGNCGVSRDCANDKSCDGGAVRKWECLYDNPRQTTCNTGLDETRNYAPKVLACYNNN